MSTKKTRRNFIRNMSLGMGAALPVSHLVASQESNFGSVGEIKGKICVGTISQMGLNAKNPGEMVQKVLEVMQEMLSQKPDIICLPEVFAYTKIDNYSYQIKEVAAPNGGEITTPFQAFAKENKCYVIVPTYTLQQGSIYISAIVIDRNGNIQGQFNKMWPTIGEMEAGVRPGELDPPVFSTDFGKFGIQICFDVKREEGWRTLKDGGAEIIFWPSAYAGGQEICSMAWRNQVYLVTSTQKDTARICDMDGSVLSQTGRFNPIWTCSHINLQKAFLLPWPASAKFPAILKKYGDRISINTLDEEEWTIMECLDPTLKITSVLKEFNLKTQHEALKEAFALQNKLR